MSEITVTVVYALPDRATEIEVRLASGATVADALARSGIASLHTEIDLAGCAVGIFGRRTEREKILANGDRIEIYRPLTAEPKDLRRVRAKRKTGR
jgi:uncharacterized protein